MPKFAANISTMFAEHDFLDRFEAAARNGFPGVEYLFPYGHAPERIAERLERHDLVQVLFNLPPGDWAAGERGIACLPGREGEFQDGVGRAIDYAKVLGNSQVHCMAGLAPEGADPDSLLKTYRENLRFAADQAKAAGLTVLLEPINSRDMPGYFLNHSDQALAVIDAVGADNLLLQYDIYHMQIMEGDLAPSIAAKLDRIGHMQFADTPGRHEPGTGEINHGFLFDFIDRIGYTGWIGAEYKPAAGTEEGLGWYAPFAGRAAAAR